MMDDYKVGFGLVIGFIGHFNPQLMITPHRSLLHTDWCSQLWSSLRCLVTSSNSGRSSASGLTSSQTGGHLTPTSYSSNCVSGLSRKKVQSYVTTDSQSASLSWNKTPIWGLKPHLLLLSGSCRLVGVGRSRWRDDGFVVCQLSRIQSRSYFTTGDLPPISSSWHQAPWDPRPVLFFNWTPAVIVFMSLSGRWSSWYCPCTVRTETTASNIYSIGCSLTVT
jgi:hypothetical protein